MPEDEIKAHVKERTTAYAKSGKKPKILETLPWYVYDMHTRQGKAALRAFMKRTAQDLGFAELGLTEEKVRNLWFQVESGRVAKGLWQPVELRKGFAHTNFESPWWRTLIEKDMPFDRCETVDQVLKFWDSHIREPLVRMVQWAIQKVV